MTNAVEEVFLKKSHDTEKECMRNTCCTTSNESFQNKTKLFSERFMDLPHLAIR